jgi:hypothetical protein
MWVHIATWWYDFEQKQRDAEFIKTLTKADLLTFFDRHFFHSESNPIRRLAIHVTSQRLHPSQLAGLVPHLRALEIPVDLEQIRALIKSRPTVEEAQEFVEQVLRGCGKSDDDLGSIKQALEKLREGPVPEGYTLIVDAEQWKGERERAPPAHPVQEVGLAFLALLMSLRR